MHLRSCGTHEMRCARLRLMRQDRLVLGRGSPLHTSGYNMLSTPPSQASVYNELGIMRSSPIVMSPIGWEPAAAEGAEEAPPLAEEPAAAEAAEEASPPPRREWVWAPIVIWPAPSRNLEGALWEAPSDVEAPPMIWTAMKGTGKGA